MHKMMASRNAEYPIKTNSGDANEAGPSEMYEGVEPGACRTHSMLVATSYSNLDLSIDNNSNSKVNRQGERLPTGIINEITNAADGISTDVDGSSIKNNATSDVPTHSNCHTTTKNDYTVGTSRREGGGGGEGGGCVCGGGGGGGGGGGREGGGEVGGHGISISMSNLYRAKAR